MLVAAQLAKGSSVYENIYFPRITHSEVVEQWKDIYKNINYENSKYSCMKLHS